MSLVHGMGRAVRAKFALYAALRASSCLSDFDTLVWTLLVSAETHVHSQLLLVVLTYLPE